MFRDPSFGFCLGIKLTEVTGGVAQPSAGSYGPRHLDAPMIPLLYWPQYNTPTVHESENMCVGRLGGKYDGGKRHSVSASLRLSVTGRQPMCAPELGCLAAISSEATG
jgi:hypothetical protein